MIVLSIFFEASNASLVNHRRYARSRMYKHRYFDASAIPTRLQWLYKYERLLNTLRHAKEGDVILMMSENAAIVSPVAMETFVQGLDYLLIRVSAHALPQVDVQFWRNTAIARQAVLRIAQRCRLGEELPTAEAKLLTELESVHCAIQIADHHPVMQAGHRFFPDWNATPTFAISIDDSPHDPDRKWESARYREALIDHLNERKAAGAPLFTFSGNEEAQCAERSVYNGGKAVAIVTLYTPNVASYARIAEENFKRYCEIHGYTLYVHREIPAEVGLQANGNWLKPWLLHAYLLHHDWVIWLDSDVLVADLERPLDALLQGRDALVAHDIGKWDFNAGVVGLRHTDKNLSMLLRLMSVISSLADLSDVYSNSGDQNYFIDAVHTARAIEHDEVCDFLEINTPWMVRQTDSFMVHYLGMWPEMRALMMMYDLMN
ncbi:galactosyl transferase GMA12/MNN10 domain protein [Burkholderia ubonensis]|nr:galactosyl transferase GMA12/MNN10 domain protein [Burkholderia ubonensis]KVW21749.1 galactosyl transferase GMA12/MNN10 domain protein [Burkholderia ubonensis]